MSYDGNTPVLGNMAGDSFWIEDPIEHYQRTRFLPVHDLFEVRIQAIGGEDVLLKELPYRWRIWNLMAAQRPSEARQAEFAQRNVLKFPCNQFRESEILKHGTYRIGRFLLKTKGNHQVLWEKSLAKACAARARRWRIKPVLACPQDALLHPSLTDDIPNRDAGRSQRP